MAKGDTSNVEKGKGCYINQFFTIQLIKPFNLGERSEIQEALYEDAPAKIIQRLIGIP